MKKVLLLSFSTILMAAALPAAAQSPGKFISFGFGLEAGLPANGARSVFNYNYSGGLTLRFALHAGPGFVTLTAGGIVYVPQTIDGQNTKVALQIPVKAGYKFIFARHFFVMGELGYSVFNYYYDKGDNTLAHTTTGGFTYAPGVGFQIGVLELGVRYETIQLKPGNLSFVGLRLGFNF
jgi:hypothetical protein